ncbi:transcriptional repressor [Acinetobacter bereziniae]|jgi:Fe2+ or Zn2+ uptake regulation protein|uniref:Transcriptional repressor n=1 Tax=Acinetobacter bereziniae TaxID=106648 RepID=A0A8B5S965_ACIBZ|nr:MULTISPECIES: transcriptional repressor [Acinetobacter]MEC8122896.1 transcriptional repressor [Pseudomonadota bacterium]MBJ9902907.1 transcriptional repressor [Acinetobacter bereziniae]MCM8513797.1 transcriptional repressor [Acinetobacter bereziniae]MCU4318459.1 transcriptional repressor [Acinetobacter bereziniae]MCU4597992.1 transcriptional repressor [Acinetobacter bereziniae]
MNIEIQQKLRHANLKITQARVIVFKALSDQNAQLTAKQIYQQLYLNNQQISLSTIYRVVSDLERAGLVSQKLNGRDEARYALINKSEAEFLNIHCADLKQINKSSLIESLEKVFQQFNIDILEIEFNNTLH